MRDLTTPYNLRNGDPKSSDELTPWEMSKVQQANNGYETEDFDLLDWEE